MFVFRIILFLLLISPAVVSASLTVFVSVLPHKMVVERIGGNHVEAHVMVKRGFDPATYQPTPQQIGALAEADLYLRTGMPFEDSWLSRFQATNPELKVLDLRDGIELMPVVGHGHAQKSQGETLDPHIWTDPLLLQQQALRVRDLLQQWLPERANEFNENYRQLSLELQDLHQEISQQLQGVEPRKFIVFHPAWGYFSRRYGWQQMAAEHNGKEPGARELAQLIEQARQQNIDKIFIQPQNNSKTARTLADAIHGRVLVADPLAEDYFSSLRHFSRSLGGSHD